MILLSLKSVPYITIKDAISLAEKEDGIHRVCVHRRSHMASDLFMCFHALIYFPPFISEEATIQKERMLNKHKP